MTHDFMLRYAIRPALTLLPPQMTSREAEVMLLATAAQESGLRHRTQVPVAHAHSYWMFERGGGVAGVLRHHATAAHAGRLCAALDVRPEISAVYEALVHQDVLAAGFARLLLWTLPSRLPSPERDEDAAAEGWRQYLQAWRPGKPHPETWPGH